MRHVSFEDLANYMDGQVSESTSAVEKHLSTCSECSRMKNELHDLSVQLREDSNYEPPAELVQWGVSLFQPMLQPPVKTGGKLRKIIASLVFDTYDEPALAGVRRMGAPPRQLLFRAGSVDVDVKIESMEANDRISLVGQVLAPSAKFFENTPVKLESNGAIRYKTMTNVVGEFTFDEVPKDTYHLSVDLPEGQITLFCVHRGNS
jgi:hypothetical protein